MKNSSILKKITTHLALWIGFIAILVLLIFIQSGRIHPSLFEKLLLGALIFYINYLFLIPHLLFKKKTALYVLISVIVLVLMLFLPTIHKILFGHVDFHRHIFRKRFFFYMFMQLFFFVAAIAVRVYEQWQEHEKKAQKIRNEQISSELHYLKSQINPHFLFNSLNSIYALTVKKSEQAPEAVITLSELMRYMLYETDAHFVPIVKELHYIENYIQLQRLRMADSSDVTLEVKGKIGSQKVSPLLFISFIENAFKFSATSSGKAMIAIKFIIREDRIDFCCENTIGDEQQTSNMPEGIGLKNTKERLELLYPHKHSLQITQMDTTYAVALQLEI